MIFYKSTFKKGLSVCLIFLTGSLFYSNSLDAQCGFLPTCSSTDYLNFGMGSNTNATTLEYDNFLSAYHCTVVRTSSGNYKTWGQDMGNDGLADVLSPMIINSTNFPALTGNVLKAHLGSLGSTAQGIVLATDGLYAWSTEGMMLHANITASTAFQKLTINGNTQGLPAGVTPTDVKMMFSTNQTLGIVTCTGNVWVITQQGENTGTGLTGVLSAAAAVQWYQVTESTGGNPVLSNVIQLRGQKNTLFALKSDGTLWTWGTETYLANGTAQASLNRATQMTLPSVNPIKMIGATRNNTGNVASYYVLNADGNMYSLGNNASNQLGDWTTTERRVWVQPRFTSTVGPIMNNIHWISPQEHDRNTPSVNIITTDSTNYNWGSAAGQMLGRGGTGNFNPGIPNGILITDKVLAVETGGHTSMLAKKCEDFFGYVGHRIGGSMGDGTTTDFFEPTYTFATAIVYICGATTATVEVSGTPTLSPGGLYCNGTSTDLLPSPVGGTLSILSGPATLAGTVITFNGTGNTTVVVQYSITVPGCPIAKVATTTLLTEDCILPTVTLTGTTTIAENAVGTTTLTATLSAVSPSATTVTLTYTGTATGGDYVASSVTIIIPAGSLTGTVTIDPTDDIIFEGSETVIADITSVTSSSGVTESGTQTATVTITDNEVAPTVTLTGTTSIAENAAGVATLTATLSVAASTATTVTLTYTGTTAAGDYVASSVTIIIPAGSLTGTVTIDPTDDVIFEGSETVIADITSVTGGNGATESGTQTATVTILDVNNPPIAIDNSISTNEDVTVVLPTIQINDLDLDGTVIVGTIDLDPSTAGQQTSFTNAQGLWTVNTSTGDVTFNPILNYNGIATITYTIQDNSGATSNQANLTITVAPINDSPIVDNDVNTTTEDTPTVGGDLTDVGDIDPDGTLLVVTTTPVDGPNNGTIVINTDGTYVYTPNPNFNGIDTIVVSVCDQGLPLPGICVNDTLFITVTPVNDSPLVDNDVNTTTEDTPTVGGDLTDVGDIDPDGTLLVVTTTPVDGPNNGTIVINTDGTYVYTPNSNFNGTDTIVISVCDQGLPLPAICVNDTLFITVTPVNDSPVVDNDVNTTTEDNPTVGGDLTDSGDFDVDGNLVVTTAPISGPSNGTIVINSNGTYTYTPTTGFTGLDTIIIQICDDGTPLPVICVNDTLFINVLPCSILTLTADCDGDGVTNGDEVDPDGDGIPGPNGTNPNDPCDLNIADQVFASTSAAWLAADCDGDGVSNEEEVDPDGDGTPGPNGTNPVDPCDYDAASQIFASVTLAWLTADCDGDGEDNGDEVDPDGDGTPGPNGSNPTNPCDYTNQIFVNASPVWLVGDCDGDGVNNGDEVDPDGDGLEGPNGTNPSDSCDFNSLDQNFANVSAAWLLADCDGDGVTNGDEVDPDGDGTPGPNGTDPSNPCDLNITDQNFAIVNAAWLVLDCDGDGEENGDEVDPDGDGTPGPNGSNPTNPCDYTTQFFANVTPAWLTADCDGDGVTNGDEVDPDGDGTPGPNGTNPSDPCDLNIADQVFANANLAWLAADCDGDGVDNGDEVDPDGDGTPGPNGTNPADSCEYNSIDQIFANASAAWLAADCDGDGVTNGDEVDPDGDGTPGPNGTNPADSCDYNSIDQIFANVSAAWLAADCDGDGVDNGDEVDPDGDGSPGPNGTNPSDPCDLNIADQVFANASAAWLAADCDGDGIPNGEEVMNGSDPFNPCSPNLCDINVPEAFTPDGDGINEFFVIEGIELIPDNTIIIFNRWGSVVYSVSKYQNDWNGTTNVTLTVDGDVLPTGTYYYVFDTGVDKYGVIKGYVYIQR